MSPVFQRQASTGATPSCGSGLSTLHDPSFASSPITDRAQQRRPGRQPGCCLVTGPLAPRPRGQSPVSPTRDNGRPEEGKLPFPWNTARQPAGRQLALADEGRVWAARPKPQKKKKSCSRGRCWCAPLPPIRYMHTSRVSPAHQSGREGGPERYREEGNDSRYSPERSAMCPSEVGRLATEAHHASQRRPHPHRPSQSPRPVGLIPGGWDGRACLGSVFVQLGRGRLGRAGDPRARGWVSCCVESCCPLVAKWVSLSRRTCQSLWPGLDSMEGGGRGGWKGLKVMIWKLRLRSMSTEQGGGHPRGVYRSKAQEGKEGRSTRGGEVMEERRGHGGEVRVRR